MKFRWIHVVAALAAILYVSTLVVLGVTWKADTGATTVTEGAGEFAEEQAERRGDTRARLLAMKEAEHDGLADLERVQNSPSAGWMGEALFGAGDSTFPPENDWEPAIAADPSAPYVYWLTTRYGGSSACDTCPHYSFILVKVSSDGGATWGNADYICECAGDRWQVDPVIATDADGDVYAAWLTTHWDVVFSRSTDHGATWSTPVSAKGASLNWGDHPWITVSDDGSDVYIGFNKVANYQVASHDFGATWGDPIRTSTDGRYYYSEDGTVLPDGTVIFASTAYAMPNGRNKSIDVYAVRSTDEGATWNQIKLARVAAPPLCETNGCPKAQYGSQGSVDSDDSGNVTYVSNGGRVAHGGQQIWERHSTDGGATWSAPVSLSPGGSVNAIYPRVMATGSGDFRAVWADNRVAKRWFNVYAIRSTDDGTSWGTDSLLSDATSGGYGYKSAKGFPFSYGDYMDGAITSAGKTIATWGEGWSYAGPGNTWYNVET